jgi:hypothetical protein
MLPWLAIAGCGTARPSPEREGRDLDQPAAPAGPQTGPVQPEIVLPPTSGETSACVRGEVQVGTDQPCSRDDPARDCRGWLCLEVFTIPGPDAASRLAGSCQANVDLGAAVFRFRLDYRHETIDPLAVVALAGFLAEDDSPSSPQAPRPGDLWRGRPLAGLQPGAGCQWVSFVLDQRFAALSGDR